MGNFIMCIETFFNMLRGNSQQSTFVPMWSEYKEVIAIICTEYVKNKVNLDYKVDLERAIGKEDFKDVNFDPLDLESQPDDILINLFCSVNNLRTRLDFTVKDQGQIERAWEMKRTSYIIELEYRKHLALNYKNYPTN